MKSPSYSFRRDIAVAINSGEARTVILKGSLHDLCYAECEGGGEYLPLVDFLTAT